MVVPVLIVSCHESEKWNRGPDTAHATTTPSASPKAHGAPTMTATLCAKRRNMLGLDGRRTLWLSRADGGDDRLAATLCRPHRIARRAQRVENDRDVDRLLNPRSHERRQCTKCGENHRDPTEGKPGPDALARDAHGAPGNTHGIVHAADHIDEH